jgi:hypothetical protein
MRRRALLAGLAGGLSLLGGCVTFGRAGVPGDLPDGIASVEFSVTDLLAGDPPAPPEVAFGPDGRVTVAERIRTGPERCTDVRIDGLEYDGETLTLAVGSFRTGGGCDGYRRTVRYEAGLAFEGQGPEAVVVRTRAVGGAYEEATVRRPGRESESRREFPTDL